jgi:hypothetical protein
MKVSQASCKNCGVVKAVKEEHNIGCGCHVVHAFMTVMTGCIWLPIWIIHACYDNSKWHCNNCGARV